MTNDGEFVQLLEKELTDYLQVKNLVLVTNGTLAIQLALKALDIKGEVVTTPFTFSATTNVVLWENCTPVFADIDVETFNLNPAEIEKLITDRTTAILAVHVYGNPCNVEKLQEIVVLTKGLRNGKETIQKEILASTKAIQALNQSASRNNSGVQEAIQNLHTYRAEREAAFNIRQGIQEDAFQLPLLPTTTIGSFPQTQEVRKQRLNWRKDESTNEQYEQYINAEIKKWIEIQEELGLDVLVHGEFERTDMVEYFGEKLAGFQFTKFGWVQSYGSRCVKPPLIYGDVSYQEPMTVKETVYAQSLTTKPVKGMLTGPITILNWSFVRDDISRYEVVNQIALALRKEVEALEENGIRMIQVDEPAIREGLPLKQEKRESYLNAAVYAFKLATTSVQNETQIHTHMCYSDFKNIIDAITALDADVISIETSRSHGELIHAFEENTYDKGIGLGVYDIHSPRVPELEELTRNIDRALQVLNPKLFWINPDCGLKTRGIDETIAALKVMVEAAEQTREKLLAKQG